MKNWSPQQFRKVGLLKGVDKLVISNSISTADKIVGTFYEFPPFPPIFSLKHLSYLTKIEYPILRQVVGRKLENPYRVFKLNKSGIRRGYRVIAVPSEPVRKVQKWILDNILNKANVHSSCYSYVKNRRVYSAADIHCGCRWMIKLDVQDFFESISEISVYRVFRSFGYQPLVSLELSRLCTKEGRREKWKKYKAGRYETITSYKASYIGHLPQGAPTSPMLSNLVMKEFDKKIFDIASKFDMSFTRYADDLYLSTSDKNFNRKQAKKVIKLVFEQMKKIGLNPNISKTKVLSPGARKVVLGMLVDGSSPRLTKEFKSNLKMHFYFLSKKDVGPVLHAKKRGFVSVLGLKHHIQGLISYGKSVEPEFIGQYEELMRHIDWPL